MRRTIGILALLFAAFSLPAFAGHGNHGLNISLDSDEPVTSCDQIRVRTWDDREIARSQEQITLPATSSTVQVEAAQNGGIYLYGSDRQDFSVLNCKVAMSDERATAERKLQQIKMSFEGGRLTVNGPDEGDWTSYLIIQAPRSSATALSGMNGPIAVRDIAGKVEVHCTNGPFSISDSSGEITAQVQNGPISYYGNSGDVHLHAQNGPISVHLKGLSWSGKGLDAESTNGPLSVRIPTNYGSGVLVQTRGYSPFHCSGCNGARKDFDDSNKSVQFGTGEPIIRMSTVNGPVSINGDDME